MQSKPSIVFCHGLWADGSCFSKLIPTLQAEGHAVMASQHALDSLAGDVETAKRNFGRVPGPIILVGHSYGGSVITGAGMDERVAALVYIAALAPDADETSQSQQEKFPPTQVFQHLEVADGRVWLKRDGLGCFAGDLSEADQSVIWSTQGVPDANLFNEKFEGTAWHHKPSWFVIAKNDHTVNPDLQRAAAKRMGAVVREVDSSHVPMLSQPDAVLEVIRAAAQSVMTAKAAAE